MATSSPAEAAWEALHLSLQDSLAVVLAARDAERRASYRFPAGPYDLGAGGTLLVNGEAFPLTGGSRTAEEVAAELAGAVSFTASAEADGAGSRLLLQSVAGPADSTPAALTFEEGTAADVLAGLQLRPIHSDVVELPLAFPAPRIQMEEPAQSFVLNAPLIYLEDNWTTVPSGSLRTRIYEVTLRLAVWVPGYLGRARATIRKAEEIQRAILQVVRSGDAYSPQHVGGTVVGRKVIQAKPSRLVSSARAFELTTGSTNLPLAIVRPEIVFLVGSDEV